MNQGWIYRDRIGHTEAGWTLLAFYVQRYPHSDQAAWQHRIATGQILIDGQRSTAETILRGGQRLTYHRPPWVEPEVPLEIKILFEDTDLLVIAKPSGLPVLPGAGFLEHTLLYQIQLRYPQETPVPIHRLGRGTSGLILLARSSLGRSVLSKHLREHRIRKIYRTLVGHGLPPEPFMITQSIGKIAHPALGYIYAATADGLEARSTVQVLHNTGVGTVLEVEIYTGRPHQIRIHLATVGFPLLGDPLYGPGGVPLPLLADTKIPVPGDGGYWLHAHQLIFTHPRTGQPLHITCPPPKILALVDDGV